ncbi:unnamed protein product [Fusarium langsethiae]|nr:unnamed protein product [Fusarium langsethiae]
MGLGVLPDRHLTDVPGTSFLRNHASLKHDPTGKIVLVPQPSNDPNDPLNWPAWKKNMFTVSIIIGCGAVGAIGPLLGPAMVPLAEEFDVPLQRFTLGFTGSLLISLAFGNLFCNSLAMVIGKRPVYLLTAVGLLVTTIWSAVAKDFISLAISRAIQGFSGAIINEYGYKTCLWAMAGAFGVQLLLTIFFMPETTYKRSNGSCASIDTSTKGSAAADDKKESVSEVENTVTARDTPHVPEKHSFIYGLRPWSGYWDSSGFVYSIYAPFKMLGSPVVIWGCFQLTICLNWLVLLANTQSQIFSGPPYNFSVAQVGLTNLSSFVGTFIATALAGLMVDGLAKFMAGRNRGVYEPEFRLPILTLLATFSASGFFGWGQSLANAEPWPIPVILCLGLINLGIQLGIVGVVSYVVDSHRHEAVESYAMMSFAKNIFGFGMTFYMNDWIAAQGVRDAFFVIGGITIAFQVFFGKFRSLCFEASVTIYRYVVSLTYHTPCKKTQRTTATRRRGRRGFKCPEPLDVPQPIVQSKANGKNAMSLLRFRYDRKQALGILFTLWPSSMHRLRPPPPPRQPRLCLHLKVQMVLGDILSSQDQAIDKENSQKLESMAVEEMEIIITQVKHILGAYDALSRSKIKRFRDLFRIKRAAFKFVVTEQHIEKLIASAEKAKMSLQSAICLHKLEILDFGQAQMQDAFQIIHDSMKEHAKALEGINRDMELNQFAFDVVGVRSRPDEPLGGERSSTSNSKSKRSSRRSEDSRDCSTRQRSRTKHNSKSRHGRSKTKKRHGHGRSKAPSRARSHGKVKEQSGDAAGGYELVRSKDNRFLVMATGTDEYKSTTGRNSTEAQTTRPNRLKEELDTFSDEERDEGMGFHFYELRSSLTSTPSLTLASTSDSLNDLDADLDNMTPIIMNSEKDNHAFVGKELDLSRCFNDESNRMEFCVSCLSITDTCQIFTIQEVCRQKCEHVVLMMYTWPITKRLPDIMPLKFDRRGVLLGEMDEVQSAPYITLQSFHKCHDGNSCSHTIVHGGLFDYNGRTPQTAACVREKYLEAWLLGDYEWDSESYISTERAMEDFSDGPAPDDDQHALDLLQAIMCGRSCPARIQFGVLVEFLKLTESLHLEEEFLAPCYAWTRAILSEVSNSVDRDAIAWAWVLWKLKMVTEFKQLSGMLQQQVKHCIGQETNQYGVLIPQPVASEYMSSLATHIGRNPLIDTISGTIDQKRISALSQIRDLVEDNIETCRNNYLLASRQEHLDWAMEGEIMRSPLMVGYLTLEYERCLLNGRRGDNENLDGVSFVDASKWIGDSMMNLGNWMVRTVPPAHRIPSLLSNLAAFIPLVGVGIHEVGTSAFLSSTTYERPNDLIRRLEEEDWGVDLLQDEF